MATATAESPVLIDSQTLTVALASQQVSLQEAKAAVRFGGLGLVDLENPREQVCIWPAMGLILYALMRRAGFEVQAIYAALAWLSDVAGKDYNRSRSPGSVNACVMLMDGRYVACSLYPDKGAYDLQNFKVVPGVPEPLATLSISLNEIAKRLFPGPLPEA